VKKDALIQFLATPRTEINPHLSSQCDQGVRRDFRHDPLVGNLKPKKILISPVDGFFSNTQPPILAKRAVEFELYAAMLDHKSPFE
jgi:hypothetical protein